MVICKKGKDMISCGFKLKTEGLKYLNNQHKKELEQIFSQFQAPPGFLATNKPGRYNSLRHINGKQDLIDTLLQLKNIEPSAPSKKITKSRKYRKQQIKKTKKKR